MNDGILKAIYKSGEQIPGSLGISCGYNSVSIDHALDTDTGILTLTLTDAAAKNVACDILSLPRAVMTVRLREANGRLEWADGISDSWQVLCDTADTREPLALLREATGFGKHEEALGEGVVLVIEGDKARFRARGWKSGTDFVNDCYLHGNGNGNFNFQLLAEISADAPTGTLSSGPDVSYEVFKNAQDDVAPINMNGTYIAAGHAYNLISVVPNTFALSAKDIGTVFTREGDGQQYMLVKLPADNAWFCPFDEEAMADGNFSKYTYVRVKPTSLKGGDTIVQDGTGKTLAVTADATEAQLRHAVNHLVQHGYLNGTAEIDLTKNGVYEAEFIDIYEEYDVLYLPAVLRHLAANVGKNDNTSHFSEELTDYYFTHRNTFRFHKNGSCVIFSTYDFKKNVNLFLIGGTQSIPFATHYVYIPGTRDYGVPTLHEAGKEIRVGTEGLADPQRLASSYFQLTDADGTQGMNLGFNTEYGTGRNDIRRDYIGINGKGKTEFIFYYTTFKMYPMLISNCKLKPGDFFSCIAYRVPSYSMDGDFTAINWYWVGDDIYLSLHTKERVNKTVSCLPDYMNGMTAEVIEASEGFTVASASVKNGSISVAATDAGYAIIKLSPAK